MKKIIRNSVFETNSSSTHSLTMCMEEQWITFKKGETMLQNEGTGRARFITIEQAMEYIAEKEMMSVEAIRDIAETDSERYGEMLYNHNLCTYETWGYDSSGESYETFHDTFTTPNGDKVIAFGYYGDDY